MVQQVIHRTTYEWSNSKICLTFLKTSRTFISFCYLLSSYLPTTLIYFLPHFLSKGKFKLRHSVLWIVCNVEGQNVFTLRRSHYMDWAAVKIQNLASFKNGAPWLITFSVFQHWCHTCHERDFRPLDDQHCNDFEKNAMDEEELLQAKEIEGGMKTIKWMH